MSEIQSIVECLKLLKTSPTIVGLLGDKADALISNELANVTSMLTIPMQGKSAQELQIQQLQCSPKSWALVVTQAVQLGITLNTFQKHAAVVPYNGNATLSIMIAGLKHLLYSNNIIKSMTANAVCENDIFEMNQPLIPETISQNFKFQKAKTNRGKIVGAYAFFVLENGQYVGDYLPIEEINLRKNATKMHFIWNQWEIEMFEKTAVRYVQKQLPTLTKFESVLNEIENQHFDFEQKPKKEKSSELPKMILTENHKYFKECVRRVAAGESTIIKLEERFIISDSVKEKIVEYANSQQ
jgi:recombinational DNA repair protein RecT